MILINADTNKVTVAGFDVKSGELGRLAAIDLSEEYGECDEVYAVYKDIDTGKTYEELVNNGIVDVPTFDEACSVKIGVYGVVKVSGLPVIRYSPEPYIELVKQGSYSAADTPVKPDYDKEVIFYAGGAEYGKTRLLGGISSVAAPYPKPPIPVDKKFLKGWGTSETATSVVDFPYTVTSKNTSLYAIFIDSYHDDLCEWFGVDKDDYPYLFIQCGFDVGGYGYIYVVFTQNYINANNVISSGSPMNYRYCRPTAQRADNIDPSNLTAVLDFIKSKSNTVEQGYNHFDFGDAPSFWVYGNVPTQEITIASHYGNA